MIEIRKANREDRDFIVDFQLKMAKETENIDLDYTVVCKGVEAVFIDDSKGNYYIASDGDRIIGSLLTTFEWSDWRNAQVFWIQSVYVIPEYRGQKVFRLMYDYIKEIALNDESVSGIRLYVDLSNEHAQRVYSNIGMNGDHYRLFEWMK